MKNRMLPFGYGMKDGRIVADRKEKEIVLWIFREYLNGKNMKKIADILTEKRITYFPEEYHWNKSRIKRMLEDSRYTGTEKYPQIVEKAVFEQAGIDTLPTTPEEFIEDLKLVKEKTDAIPLYTNYAAGWTMGAWDAYIAGTATGDATYMNQKLPHTANPFSDPGDGTHAYNVYKVLYDAVAEGLIEDDYSTTDWEGCKGMINRGEIGTMVLGSWAYSQMQAAGDKPEDIGYMSFPIKVNGKQYASAGPDYAFGINKDASDDNRLAALVFVKWMTNESGFSYNEGGIPINAEDNNYPDLYAAFDGVEYVSDETALPGEENLKDTLNSDSELNINNGGDKKVQSIIEHASNGDMTFDEIMDSWNQAWTEAQELSGVEIKY